MKQGDISGRVDSASVGVTWLGQAGYLIESGGLNGQTCLIDPYLSNWAGENVSVPRIPAIPVDPRNLQPAIVVTSHWHEDHLDPLTIRAIAEGSPSTIFVGPPSNAVRCKQWGIPESSIVPLERGETFKAGDFSVTAGFARHDVAGFVCEDAISIVCEVDGLRIFHTGDSEYDTRIVNSLAHRPIDVGLFAINGTGGNMNAREAAFLASEIDASVAIPMHYGMWPELLYGKGATLDPMEFDQLLFRLTGRHARILGHNESATF